MMNSSLDDSVVKFLKNIGVGIRPIRDPFFDESYRICKVFQKTGIITDDDESLYHRVVEEFICNGPGCHATFENLFDFEIHYNTTHRFTCSQCKKIKANARLLDIHIQETHDNFFKVLAKKQPMYQCYVPDCDIKFNDAEMRKEHCTIVHKYSKNFKYDNEAKQKIKDNENSQELMDIDVLAKNCSISDDNPKIILNKNQKMKTFVSHTKNINKVSTSKNESSPSSTSSPTSSSLNSSSLVFIPRQITHKPFSKVLTQGKTMKKAVLDSDSVMELAEALPN